MITIASIFRDSISYLDRYFKQIEGLRRFADVRLLLAEGDSTDATYKVLTEYMGLRDILVKFDHGGPNYGSVDNPARWDQIAKVVRGLLDRFDNKGDKFVWVESDLIWRPEALQSLMQERVPVAPMVMRWERFYDIWGFRIGGTGFRPVAPYYGFYPPGLVKIDSCGSCFVLSRHDYDLLGSWSGHWPFTAEGTLYLKPLVRVEHP